MKKSSLTNKSTEAPWINALSLIKGRSLSFQDMFTQDEYRIKIQFFCVYLLFGVISLGMTGMNILTHWQNLAVATLVFSLLNLINVALSLINAKTEELSRVLFAIEIVLLFTYFALTGEPQGFSIIWSVLLPTCGMLLYRVRHGLALSSVQLVIFIFLFWTAPGRGLLQYDYSPTFMQRFPVLFFSFIAAGAFFEVVRALTQMELTNTRNQFEYLSNHDSLTGLFNRAGFNKAVDSKVSSDSGACAFAIADLDHFKDVNDEYGHDNGDRVLQRAAGIISSAMEGKGIVGRWGGEEFSMLFYGENVAEAEAVCGSILDTMRNTTYTFDGVTFTVTTSIGLVTFLPEIHKSRLVFSTADDNLYIAKEQGRNRIISSRLDGR